MGKETNSSEKPQASKISVERGQLTTSQELQDVFQATFPHHQEEIVCAFGYGSGVFLQTDDGQKDEDQNAAQDEEKKMLDMILIVKDALQFHSVNSRVNPDHYAPLFRDPNRAAWWQTHTLPSNGFLKNPKIFFNFVEEPFLKYGIMEESDLVSDLQNWDSLYIAGRMHKPTATIFQQDDTAIEHHQENHNLPAALSTALLLSATQESLSLPELYSQISGLSYTGDFRMQVGAEDPGKINKLVHSPGQLDRFHQLYQSSALQPLIQSGVVSLDKNRISWNPKDPLAISHLCQKLPLRLQKQVEPANNPQTIIQVVQKELHSIVAPAARYQSFKGLWTAGLAKSARYAFAKLSKGILRR